MFIFFFSVKLSASSFSQDVKVTLELEQVSVKEFLKTVQQQTGINFLYNANLIESIDRVNVYARDKELRLVLQETLSPMGLVFVFQEGTVIIKKAEEKKQPKQKFVVGVVRDEVKNPLPGVTVQLKGLNVGFTGYICSTRRAVRHWCFLSWVWKPRWCNITGEIRLMLS